GGWPVGPGSRDATWRAVPTELRALAEAAAGRWVPLRRWTRSWRYSVAPTLPMTATPSAPPTWRVVSLTAEPTPARSRPTAPMIDAVAGARVRATPRPSRHWVIKMAS